MRVVRLIGLALCCLLMGIGEVYGQQQSDDPNEELNTEPPKDCSSAFMAWEEECQDRGGGGGDTIRIELAGPVTAGVEYLPCVREIVMVGVIPVPIFGVQKVEYKLCIDPQARDGVCILGSSWPEVGSCV